MHRLRRRRSFLGALALVALAGCGTGNGGEEVRAGAPTPSADPTTSTQVAPTTNTTAAPPATSSPSSTAPITTAAGPVATTTPPAGPSDASVVEGLSPEQLRAAVVAPVAPSLRSAPGPTAERVSAGGTTAWRIRIPGGFTARSARVTVSVGDRVVGQGVVAADLERLVAVTLDGTGLVSGAKVSYTWEGSAPTDVGLLVVAR